MRIYRVAIELHEMNKDMRTLREQMETTFKRELVNLASKIDYALLNHL